MTAKLHMINSVLEEKIKSIVSRSQCALSQDSIMAVMALEDEMERSKKIVELLLEGTVEATYIGKKKDNMLDPDKYSIRKRAKIIDA